MLRGVWSVDLLHHQLTRVHTMTNSNQKGKRGEREAARALKASLGCAARRGQQFCGGGDSPDVVTDIAGMHIEVKRTERFSLYDAMAQAKADAGSQQVPVVMHRKNNQDWVAVVMVTDLPRLADILADILADRKDEV